MSAYLELLKKALTGMLYEDPDVSPGGPNYYDQENRRLGKDIPRDALTMVGVDRLTSLERMIMKIVLEDMPGDLVECGSWRGGAAMFMRAVLNEFADGDNHPRTVYVCDSFEGLPEPTHENDKLKYFHQEVMEILKVSLPEVVGNFERWGLGSGVCYAPFWFRDLGSLGTNQIALLRADGDMYESTWDILNNLYPRVVLGGFVVIDDYLSWPACRRAVTDYRIQHGIIDPIHVIDWTAVYWKKIHG